MHLAVVFAFWSARDFSKRGAKGVCRVTWLDECRLIPVYRMILHGMVTHQDWCDLHGSRLRLLGGYIIRLAQRTSNAKLLVCYIAMHFSSGLDDA